LITVKLPRQNTSLRYVFFLAMNGFMKHLLFSLFFFLPGFLTAQWVQVPSPTSFEELNNLYFINDTVGFAGDQNSKIVTYDGGRSWSMNPGFTDLVKACYVDSLNGFGITQNNFYQTFDGGANWISIKDSVDITSFFILECVNGKVFVVGNKSSYGYGSGYWYVSDDVGTSWEMRYQQDSTIFGRGRFVDDQNIFGVAISHHQDVFRATYHYIKSTDGGYTWQTIDFPANYNTWHDIFCLDEDTCFSVDAFHGLGFPSFKINQLDFSTGNETLLYHQQQGGLGFIEGFDRSLFIGGGGLLTVSPDRGRNWINQNISFLSGQQRVLLACHVFNDSSAVVTGSQGCIIRTDNFGLGLSEKFLRNPGFSVFPNPSSKGYQHIALTGITPHTMCNIDLFDLRGNKVKQVFSGRIESSDQHIRVDLGDLAAGSYFYRVQTDEGVSQKKVVVY
jgi:photosystem II stability/assembly factor-like uncharacterized protein